MNCNDIAELRAMLTPPLGCGECPLDSAELGMLLDRNDDVLSAAYEGCVRLAEGSALKLPDGTQAPDQSGYWRRLAALYRPNHGRNIARDDHA